MAERNPGSTATALKANLMGSSDAKSAALVWLVAEGYLRVENGPHASHLHFVAKPLPEDVVRSWEQLFGSSSQ